MTQNQKKATQDLIAALRSGKYQRCEGKLRTQDGFCPWGVACDVYDPLRWEDFEGDGYRYLDSLDDEILNGEFFEPPDDVVHHYGDLVTAGFGRADLAKILPERFTALEGPGPWTIIELNDNFHLTLPETADVLEELYLTGHYLGAKEESE